MIIQYCSDLHLELSQNSDFLKNNKLSTEGEILILAGDISYLGEIFYRHPFFDYLSENYNVVYWVPGNHEFYDGFELSFFDKPIKKPIRKNIWLINNLTVVKNDTEFFFTTLWTKLDKNKIPYVLSGAADFFKIKYNGNIIQREEFENQHELSINFLKSSIEKSNCKKKVVVTLHVPSQQCNAIEYKNSWINSAFVVEMKDFILANNIDL